MPPGFLGTRADGFMDAVIILLTALPILLLLSFRFARRGATRRHRNIQATTPALVLSAVLLFEADVRHSGGKAAFLALNPGRASLVEPILRAHIVLATITFLAWLFLAGVSWRRYGAALPGSFGALHRRLGKITFAAVCLVSLSGALMYLLVYVL